MTAGPPGAPRLAARYAQAVLAAVAAVGFAWSGIDTLAGAGADSARTVLGAVLLAAAVVCTAGLVPIRTARPSAAGWGFVTAAITAALAADVMFLDVARTPSAQPALDAALAAVALGETALAVWFLHLSLLRARAAALTGALAVAGLLAGFIAWTGYVCAPQRVRPALRITTAFTGAHRVDDATGSLDHVMLTGTITVHNTGAQSAVVAGSLLDVVGHTSAPAATPISAAVAAGFETDIADALDAAHALEPLGPNQHALSGFWPTSDQSQSLLELDEVLPGGTQLAPGGEYTRRFSVDVPALVENPLASVTLDAEVVGVADRSDPPQLRACPGQPVARDGHLPLQHRSRTRTGFFDCVRTAVAAPTPFGPVIDDDPAVRVSFELGDTALPGSATGRVVVDPAAEQYLPVATAAASAETEVTARADAGP